MRSLFEWLRQHWLALVVLFVTVVVTSLVSAYIADNATCEAFIKYLLLTLVSMFFAWAVLRSLQKWKRFRPFYVFAMTGWGWRKNVIPALAVAVGVTAVCIAVYIYVVEHNPPKGVFPTVLENPGGMLAIAGTLVSFIGLYLAAHSVQELRQVITTFRECSLRLLEMIKETMANRDQGDIFRMLCYTPLPGSLALPRGQYGNLREALCNPDLNIEYVVLQQDDLSKWLGKFVGKKRPGGEVSRMDVDTAMEDISSFFLARQRRQNPQDGAGGDPLKVDNRRKSIVQLPGFYIFLNNSKAIVVTPLFIPLPGAPWDHDNAEHQSVQLVGFVTTDPMMREQIQEVYERYRDLADSPDICENFEASNNEEFVCRCQELGWNSDGRQYCEVIRWIKRDE
jgi:hypothetical protein